MTTPVFVPKEVKATADDTGVPTAIVWNNRPRQVISVRNRWRIDDEWWREEIARRYFELELDNGLVITVFHDLVSGKWYQQRY
jgi:hypothetical protein